MTEHSQAQAAEAWRQALEAGHAPLQRCIPLLEHLNPGSPAQAQQLHACARSIETGLAHLYDAADGRVEPLAALQLARNAVSAGRNIWQQPLSGGAADAVAMLELSDRALAEAEQACSRVPAPEQPAAEPLQASRSRPRVHRLQRSVCTPSLRLLPSDAVPGADVSDAATAAAVFEPLPPPTDPEQFEGYAARAEAHIQQHIAARLAARDVRVPAPAPADPEQQFAERWARDCFDEIAMLGSQRLPLLGDDWRLSEELEKRMLWTLDAFASLGGPALASLEERVLDAPAPDPQRLFAAALLAGCIEGRDALGLIERLVRANVRDAAALQCFADACRLIPHPQLVPMLRTWLQDDDPALREVAARALVARAALTAAELERCVADRDAIAAVALLPLCAAGHPAAGPAVERAVAASHAGLREAGWLATAWRSPGQAAELLRAELVRADWEGDGGARAAELLAIVGSQADAQRLIERAQAQPSPASIAAAAVAGSAAVIEPLLTWLSNDDPDIALAAATGLERTSGADLRGEVQIDPQSLTVPELPEPAIGGFAGPPLTKLVSDPRNEPSEGSADTLLLPLPDAALWRSWWQEHRRDFAAEHRYRAGQAHSAAVVLAELEGPRLSTAERQTTGLEMLLHSLQDVGFDVAALVIDQHEALQRWHAARARASVAGWLC